MDSNTLVMIVSAVIVVSIIFFLAKKLIKIALLVGLALLLFNVGFVLNGTEAREAFKFDNLLSTEQADKAEKLLNDFDEKRDEYGVIDAGKIYDEMESAAAKGAVIIIEGIGNLDIKAFADAIAVKIVEVGEKNIDMEALRAEIKDQLGSVSEEQMDTIMDQIDVSVQEQLQESKS